MFTVSLYVFGSVILVSLLSLLGIIFFLWEKMTVQRTLLYFVSFSTGALLGDVFIHILPEIAEGEGFARALYVVLGGIVFSFVVEKVIHWRHCHVMPEADCCEGHGHNHANHTHHHHHVVGMMSIMGESVHNCIDGLIIAASFLASVPIGISTTLAVIFHEIPHEIGNFAVLLHSGFTLRKAVLLNLLSATTGLLGAAAVLATNSSNLQVYLLPFAAGNLLYIAGSDLIPELHRETAIRRSIGQLVALIAGMGVMYLILFWEL